MDIESKITCYEMRGKTLGRGSHDAISRRTVYLEDTWFFKTGIILDS
jgi:hypothetical protein